MSKFYPIACGILCACAVSAGAADWPQYRGPNHDGISNEKIAKSWPSEGPKVLWKTELASGFSTLAVSQGKAFTLVQRSIDGAQREVCIALNAGTGKELWAVTLTNAKYDGGGDSGAKENAGGDGPRSTPSIDDGRVYVLSAFLKLYCLDAETGKEIWAIDIQKEYSAKNIQWQSAASPLIEDGLIFINGTGPGQSLIALNKADGSLAWKGQDDKMTHATPIAATILGMRQVIFFTQTGLVSVAPKTGNVLWRYKFPYAVSTAASPVVGGDIVYCSAGYGVGGGAVKIAKDGDQFTATEIWRKPNKVVNHWSTPVYLDGFLYGPFSFKDYGKGPIKCVNIATGEEVWSQGGFGPGGVVLAGDQLVVLSDKGELVLVEASPKAFAETARFKAIEGKCWNTFSISNGRAFIRSTKEGACVDLSGGK